MLFELISIYIINFLFLFMEITICSSVDFTPKIIEIKKQLEERGHKVNIPYFTEKIINGEVSYEDYMNKKNQSGDIGLRDTQDIDLIKRHEGLIKNSEAILVLNIEKKGIKNYIGGSTLMEMGFAYIQDKKIYLYNPIPERSERMHYVDEIIDMKPIILNQDLNILSENHKTAKIILATKSHYRKAAFEFLGLDFIAEGSNVEEYFDGRPDTPEELVKHLAQLKAEAVAKNHFQGIVIGFDSVGVLNNQILEKPKSRQEAFERLKSLSGNSHDFYTGIYMINLDNNRVLSDVVKTEALVRDLTDLEINEYLETDNKIWPTTCLGYDSLENYSCSFVKEIKGDYNNFTRGLPLGKIIEMLKEIKKMKIFIAGSMSFAKEFVETKKILEELGFLTAFAPDTYDCLNNPHLNLNEDLEHCEKTDIMRACMDEQKDCDAILVLNYPKENFEGYIGSHSLIELGIAYYLNQKVFLLYPPPEKERARYHVEVMHMKPIILHGNLNKLKEHIS